MAENDKAKDDKRIEEKVDEIMARYEPRALTEEERQAMMQRLRDQYGTS